MKTRFAKVGDAHVAYAVDGDGPLDMLYVMGEYLPIDALDEEPTYARVLRRLRASVRLIVFNRRGVGLSDPAEYPLTIGQQVEDAVAVLDDVGSKQAVVFGANIGGPAAIGLAAERPERVAALVLVNVSARLMEAPGYDIGFSEAVMTSTAEQATTTETLDEFDFLSTFAPSVAADDRFRRWWDSAGHRGLSPARARDFWMMVTRADVRDQLASVVAPTLVVHRTGLLTASHGRFVSEHIRGAKFVELPGHDLMWWVGDPEAILDEVESFLATAVGSAPKPRRALRTVLLTDVVSSTERAAALGDQRWREVLDGYYDIARAEVARYAGVAVGTSGDGFVATFDMPADAIRCASALTRSVRPLQIDIRAGIHTGEIEILGDDIAGIGVHIAARVMAEAGAGEVFVSRTVADLVTGSGFSFGERGEHELKGVPGRWALFSLES